MSNGFPQRLKALRERRRMSRKALAELCQIDPEMVRRYEQGTMLPRADKLKRLADYFEVTMDDLWGAD